MEFNKKIFNLISIFIFSFSFLNIFAMDYGFNLDDINKRTNIFKDVTIKDFLYLSKRGRFSKKFNRLRFKWEGSKKEYFSKRSNKKKWIYFFKDLFYCYKNKLFKNSFNNVEVFGENGFLKILNSEKNFICKKIISEDAQVVALSDLHANGRYFLAILIDLMNSGKFNKKFELSKDIYFVCGGDFIDRAMHNFEVMCLLMLMYLKNPEKVILLKGNHEGNGKFFEWYGKKGSTKESLFAELSKSCAENSIEYKLIKDIFRSFCDTLPMTCFIGKKIGKKIIYKLFSHAAFDPRLDYRRFLDFSGKDLFSLKVCSVDNSALFINSDYDFSFEKFKKLNFKFVEMPYTYLPKISNTVSSNVILKKVNKFISPLEKKLFHLISAKENYRSFPFFCWVDLDEKSNNSFSDHNLERRGGYKFSYDFVTKFIKKFASVEGEYITNELVHGHQHDIPKRAINIDCKSRFSNRVNYKIDGAYTWYNHENDNPMWITTIISGLYKPTYLVIKDFETKSQVKSIEI